MEMLQKLQRTLLDQMQCVNCYYYDWRQPEDKRTLIRCAACHLITYCSKQCQTEHWHKVHKVHCKWMRPNREFPNSKHVTVNCPTCAQAERDSREGGSLNNLKQMKHPVLPCSLSNNFRMIVRWPSWDKQKECVVVNWAFSPFPLGQMTGQFSTNEERTVSLLFRILYKLKICGHRELIQRPELYDKVEQHLKNIWEVILQTALVDSLTQKELGDWRFRSLPPLSQGISNASMECLSARLHDLREKGDIRPWEIFLHLLAIMAFQSKVYEMRMIGLDNLPVLDPAIMRHLRKRLPPEQYHDKWRQLLDTMPGVMAPRRVTLRIMYEIFSQECIGCFRQVKWGEGLYGITMFESICCGRQKCLHEDGLAYNNHQEFLIAIFKHGNVAAELCHYCGLTGDERPHRCSRCKTKVYCGEECRNADWQLVHKDICNKGDISRKVLKKKKERIEEQRKRDVESSENVLAKQMEMFGFSEEDGASIKDLLHNRYLK